MFNKLLILKDSSGMNMNQVQAPSDIILSHIYVQRLIELQLLQLLQLFFLKKEFQLFNYYNYYNYFNYCYYKE